MIQIWLKSHSKLLDKQEVNVQNNSKVHASPRKVCDENERNKNMTAA